jgi:elongation factor G
MKFSKYDKVPPEIQQELLAAYEAETKSKKEE